METHNLAVPQSIGPVMSNLRVIGLEIQREPVYLLRILLKDDQNRISEYNYRDSVAQPLIVALNKANLTAKSLERRILEQLATDGKIAAGSISGSPD